MADHPLAEDVYKPDLGEEVELFMLDWSDITNDSPNVAYFCPSAQRTAAVRWKNKAGNAWVDYNPLPIIAEGFEAKSDGTLPRPKLTVSNVEATLGAMAGPLFSLVYLYQDLLGAKLTRYKTLGKYLGGNTEANYDAHFPEDVYVFHQKMNHNSKFIEWELAPDFDAQGILLPRRIVGRDWCQHRYRRWDATLTPPAFVYDNTENRCPIINRGLITADLTFDTDSGWTIGTNWGRNAGTGFTKTAGNTATLSGTTRCLATQNYSVTLTITGRTAGNLSVYLGGAAVLTISSNLAAHTFGAYCSATNAPLSFTADADFNGKISALSMEFYADLQDNDIDLDGPQDDVCSHTLAGCRLRWPGVALPFSGFPGVSRVRV